MTDTVMMAPASIVVRLTESLVAGYETYCFKADGKLPNVVDDILAGDYKGCEHEFFIGGELVKRGISEEKQKALADKKVTLDRDARRLLEIVANKAMA